MKVGKFSDDTIMNTFIMSFGSSWNFTPNLSYFSTKFTQKKIIFVIILCGFLTCKCYVFKKFSYLMQISTYERCNNFLFVEENLTKWPLLHAAKRASLSVDWRVFSRVFFGNFPLALKNTFRLLKFVLQIRQFQKVGKFKKWHCQVSFSHFRIDKNFYYFASVHLYSVKIMMGFQFNLNAKRKISRRKKGKRRLTAT